MKIVGFYYNNNFTKVKNNSINHNDKIYALLPLVSNPIDKQSLIDQLEVYKPKESIWTTINNSLETIAEFCKGVLSFFKFIGTVITNFSTISFWVCLCLFLIGFLMNSIADVRQGKTIAVFSFVFYILVQVISFFIG